MSEKLLIWNTSRSRYEWRGPYETKHLVDRTGAGFVWDKQRKVWWTYHGERAAKLRDYADASALERLEKTIEQREEAFESSRRLESDYQAPAPRGLAYMPFQRAGIEYAIEHNRCLIGDEMGLGKTIQALGVLNVQHASVPDQRVLVICPASLKINWCREAEKWLVSDWEFHVVNAKDRFPNMSPKPYPTMVIINYDILGRYQAELREYHWDAIIVDECHYVRNPKTKRSKEIFGTKGLTGLMAERWMFLSGTPMANRPVELLPFVRFCAPEAWRGWHWYVKQFCAAFKETVFTKAGPKSVWNTDGNSNLDELQQLCRSHFMVRRRKMEVLKDLPAKTRQVVELPLNGGHRQVKEENRAWVEWRDKLEDLKVAVELAKVSDDEEEYREALAALQQGVAIAFKDLSRARKHTAMAKVPWVIERVKDALEEGPVVVFGWHKEVLQAVRDELGGGLITGDTPAKQRQQHVDNFQEGRIDLIIGTMGAMGVGLTLVRSSVAIFAELDWVPANVSQAEDRIHRHGQERAVLIQHLVFPGSLDARLAHTMVEKQDVIDAGLDVAMDFAGIDAEPIIPDLGESAAGVSTRDKLAEDGAKLSPGQVAAIHKGLQLLSEMCDGANAEDGMGFNKIDTRVGKSLAACPHLSQRQAALGKRLIERYRRQLTDEILEGARVEA